MAKNTYQTYTEETPIETYRADFIRRSAMCAAMTKRYPALGPVGTEADGVLGQIDTRRTALQQAEDDQVRARAIEDVEKLDLIDLYTELRRTMAVKSYDDVSTVLPDAPSALGRLGVKSLGERADQAVANLQALPNGDPLKTAFLPKLQQELAELRSADHAEDATRATLHGGRMALTLYKSELSQAREIQLGSIQTVFGDREKTAQFTMPWRKASKGAASAEEEAAPVAQVAPGTTPVAAVATPATTTKPVA